MTTEHSPFAPPKLGDVPASAPPPGVPTLPPSLTTPPASAPESPESTPPAVTLAASTGPTPSPRRTPSPGRTPSRRRLPFIGFAILAIITIAGAAWFSLSSADSTSPPQDPAPPAELDIAPQDVSSPIVVPIDDASEVIAQVNDNSAEAEALDALGLDEAGNEVTRTEPFGIGNVLDPVTMEYTTSTSHQLGDGSTRLVAEVDAFAYSQGHPNEHRDWVTVLGYPAETAVVQPGEIVVVEAVLGVDGSTVVELTVRTSRSVTSTPLDEALDEVPDSGPVIETPEI